MTPKERERLINILARTTSSHDGEALAAVRKANDILERNRMSWAEFIGDIQARAATRTQGPGPERHAPAEPEPQGAPGWGRDIFGDSPARGSGKILRRKMLSGRLRLFLAGVAWPLRLLLGPMTVAAYCAAWVLESDDVVDVIGRSTLSAMAVIAAGVAYAAFAIALIREV